MLSKSESQKCSTSRQESLRSSSARNDACLPAQRVDNAIFETESLIRSLAEVEQAHRMQVNQQSPNFLSSSQISPTESSTYGRMRIQPSPLPSIAASEQTRASSRNTNQSYVSQLGPALVEEMTLSDLEDEISSSLMASKESSSKYSSRRIAHPDQNFFSQARSRNPVIVPPHTFTHAASQSAFSKPPLHLTHPTVASISPLDLNQLDLTPTEAQIYLERRT